MNEVKEMTKRPIPIDKEVVWDKTQTIMSKTDLYGTIEYANEVFVDVCGYEDYELMAQPHNIVRHPDMPKVVFKVLWENIQKGNQFHGIVKNLAKSGRYYWVITNFEYSRDEDGNIVNYIARRKAVPQDVITKHIEPLYKKLLLIEEASGVGASEKYLIGFLEEQGLSYVDLITKLMVEDQKNQKLQQAQQTGAVEEMEEEEEVKGFFSRFFGR
ncbi:PAS domain-containing protein [Flavobacterium sp. ZT3R18]|uniref:PAS domain-containing protein n=1 Tax=Flavobacterium sp. ZT3R18 TaxID=2594429 RepID=UPI001179A261|nr:PAS domain-containing protein [Flavobacterium sp. ZT3R18]TRX36095.1 PAS domain-containing protein [Flavobacterium sp. ZT3R18]